MITDHRKRYKTMQSGMPHFGATLGAPKEQLAAISHSLAEGNEVCSNWDLRDVLRDAVV